MLSSQIANFQRAASERRASPSGFALRVLQTDSRRLADRGDHRFAPETSESSK
jgi:hypothetical protein